MLTRQPRKSGFAIKVEHRDAGLDSGSDAYQRNVAASEQACQVGGIGSRVAEPMFADGGLITLAGQDVKAIAGQPESLRE